MAQQKGIAKEKRGKEKKTKKEKKKRERRGKKKGQREKPEDAKESNGKGQHCCMVRKRLEKVLGDSHPLRRIAGHAAHVPLLQLHLRLCSLH